MYTALVTIALLHWAVLLLPGFNFVLIGQLAASGKRSVAMAAVAGMTTATLVWASLAVMGVGVVFTAHPSLRQIVQVAGGLYLVYLAIKLWRTQQSVASQDSQPMGSGSAFRVGFLTSALNPKIALFYGSVFATALPKDPSIALVAAAVGLVFFNSIIWHSFLAIVLSHPKVQRAYLSNFGRLNKAAGLLVGAFGIKLLVATVQELQNKG